MPIQEMNTLPVLSELWGALSLEDSVYKSTLKLLAYTEPAASSGVA